MTRIFLIVLAQVFSFTVFAQDSAHIHFRNDFDFFWENLKENYCYWDKKATDWDKVRSYYAPAFDTVTSRESFILLLEKVFNEIYDHHASLNNNTPSSQRLVPSGTDIWAEYVNGVPTITEVRVGFGAEKAGLKADMEVVSVNDIPIEIAVNGYFSSNVHAVDKEARDYALRLALAGKFIDDRKIKVKDKNIERVFYPDRPVALLRENKDVSPIESKVYPDGIGYIRINNRLWDNDIIPLFDSILQSFKNTRSLILDMRETPSGGNTTVARAILGSFIKSEGFYQKHELTVEERQFGIKRSWMEIVSPRKIYYPKPLVILVNHWTGSVGEGITIGFDALKRGTIIGTKMPGLMGAVYSFQMPSTKIGFAFPVEKLYHVNGTPRENFSPSVVVDLTKQKTGEDLILETALKFLKNP